MENVHLVIAFQKRHAIKVMTTVQDDAVALSSGPAVDAQFQTVIIFEMVGAKELDKIPSGRLDFEDSSG